MNKMKHSVRRAGAPSRTNVKSIGRHAGKNGRESLMADRRDVIFCP